MFSMGSNVVALHNSFIFILYNDFNKKVNILKISLKLGLYIFSSIFLLETVSMLYLHNHVIQSRINQELESLKSRGNSHRDVLELSYSEGTLKHIGLMESHTDTDVVITHSTGDILQSSENINAEMKTILRKTLPQVPRKGLIIQSSWKDQPYIATVTPYNSDNEYEGYVYMFKNTGEVEELIAQLNKHFLLQRYCFFSSCSSSSISYQKP